MSKQGNLYQFVLWLDSELKKVNINVVIQSIEGNEFFKQYTILINGKIIIGDEEAVREKLIKYAIETLVVRI